MANATKPSNTATKSNKATKATKKPQSVELTPEALSALADFRKAKEAEAKAKEAKLLAEAELRSALGEALFGTVAGAVVIKVVSSRSTHFDREMLENIYPEAYSATLRVTEYDYLKTL